MVGYDVSVFEKIDSGSWGDNMDRKGGNVFGLFVIDNYWDKLFW